MSQPLSFLDVILRLQQFWADQGCIIWQPYNVQVGAGTMNPATILRVLGPEPWKVAYVEPSVRPDDGRYGENPNRMQVHYQLQVILKPDPGNPQEIYLQSLEALGIDRRQHDIRFVEDNWGSGEEAEIITGNSLQMKAIVINVLKEYKLEYSFGRWSDTWNKGYIVIWFE